MNEEDNLPEGDFDRTWAANRAAANSDEAEAARLEKELGLEDPPMAIPVPNVSHETNSPGRTPTSDATHALMAPVKAVGNAAMAGLELAGEAAAAGGKMLANPKQALAGIGSVLDTINNFGMEAAYSFDAWMRGNKLTQADLKDIPKSDIAGMIADAPQDDSEKTARSAARFVSQIGLAVTAGAAALPMGAVAAMGTAGAVNMLSFDPHDEGLSDFIQKNPEMRNAFTEWWSVKEEDSVMELRMKNFLAGAVGEGLGVAVLKGLKMYKARSALKSLTDEAAQIPASAKEAPGEIKAPQIAPEAPAAPVAPLATEETLRAAEGTAAPLPASGPEAPLTPDKPRGAVIARNVEREAMVPRQQGAEETLDKFEAAVNTNKIRYFGLAEKMAKQVDPSSFQNASRTWEQSRDKAIDLLLDPVQKAELRMTTKLNADLDQHKIFAANLERDIQWENYTADWVEVDRLRKSGASPEVIQAAEMKAVQTGIEVDVWGAIAENKARRAGQALNAVKGANALPGTAKFRQRIVDRDVLEKAMASEEGRAAFAAQMAEGAAKEAAGDPQFVRWSDKLKSAWSKMLQGNKITDVMQSLYVEFKLSNPFTFSALNIGSQAIQGTLKAAEPIYTNRAARLLNAVEKASGKVEKLTKGRVAILDKKAADTSAEAVMKAFKIGKQGGFDSLDDVPSELIEQWKKFENYRAINPDAGRIIEGQAMLAFQASLKNDLLKLHGLAKDGKFVSGTQAKFGSVARTHTIEELSAMDPDQRIGVLLTQFKKEINLPGLGPTAIPMPSQIMATGDAIMGAVIARTEHEALARRFALSQAEGNPLLIEKFYKEALNDPPVWMRQKVIDAMDRANFTTEITPETNPVLHWAKAFVNSNGITRQLVPFQTVAINGVSQAVEHSPLAPFISKRFKDAFNAGGLARDQAVGRVMLGTEFIALGGTLYGAGLITGKLPRDPQARDNFLAQNPGFKEDALKVGDTYLPLRVLEGPGRVLKYGAYMAQMLPFIDEEDTMREWQDYILAGSALVAEQMSPDFLIQENGKITSLLQDPTGPEGKRYLAQKLSSPFIIEGARFTRNIVDKERRKTDADNTDGGGEADVLEMAINSFKNAHPFLSRDLVPYRNMFGDTVEYSLPLTGPENTSPIAFSRSEDRTVENEIVRLGMSNHFFKEDAPEGDKHLAFQMPRKTIQEDGVTIPLSPKQYDDYVRLAAGDFMPLFEAGIMSEKDAVTASTENLRARMKELISSDEWKELPDKWKKVELATIVKDFRKVAKDYIFEVHPDLRSRQTIELLNQQKASLPEGPEGEEGRLQIEAEKKSVPRYPSSNRRIAP